MVGADRMPWKQCLILCCLVIAPGVRGDEFQRVVSVSAQSEFRVTPDEAIISFSVDTHQPQLLDAKAENDAITSEIFTFVRQQAVDDDRFQVTDLHMGPRFDRNRMLVDYGVERSFEVRTEDFSAVDFLISGIVQAGGDNISIRELKLQVSDQREHQVEARRLAVLYAREKATHLAELNGMRIGNAITITEGVEYNDDAGGFGGFGGGLGAAAQQPSAIPLADGLGPVQPPLSVVRNQSARPVSLKYHNGGPASAAASANGKSAGGTANEVAGGTDDQQQAVRGILLSPGQISLNATVSINFELLPLE